MELKASLFPLKNSNGRVIWIDPANKPKHARCSELTFLGSTVNIHVDAKTKKKTVVETGYALYETADLDVVIVKADLVPAVKGIGSKTLDLLIQSTDLTPMGAVAQGMAKFVHILPESGFYILEGAKHVWVAELPVEQEETETTAEETEEAAESHF
jgi:hypothetical protein